ncbi:hypothetical protein FGG08_004396 [Glutinoglossum americanum]|uniref:DUF6594 domain-containing protein n=1 Tax=Glutinoglossum americanum TaxID=1670608 RepID=A0A9P8IBI1_9PEZI|nr:hypothetical protein FGG08_004396 [Glutinoglossum americanum]
MKPLGGYPQLANFVSQYPGMAIFRTFARLNAQNLLCMQAEIAQLELDLDMTALEDSQSNDTNRRSFQTYVHRLRTATGSDSLQWRKLLELRSRLKEYNGAVLQLMELYRLEPPEPRDLKTLHGWLDMPECGNGFLRGSESKVFRAPDLVALSAPRNREDVFTRWVSHTGVPWFHRLIGRSFRVGQKPVEGDEESGVIHYADSRLVTTAHLLSIFASSLLPTVSIFVLYFLNSLLARLGAIMVFSFLFSSSLALFTAARRVEVFAATAAFSSVQVVFVGSTGFLSR